MIQAGETIFDGMQTAKSILLHLKIKEIRPSEMMEVCGIIMKEFMIAQAHHKSALAGRDKEIADLKLEVALLKKKVEI
jgi:hypothetical protein